METTPSGARPQQHPCVTGAVASAGTTTGNTHGESSMDFQETDHSSTEEERQEGFGTGAKTAPGSVEASNHDDKAWDQALSRRTKKRLRQEAKLAEQQAQQSPPTTKASTATQRLTTGRPSRSRRRLPPLPKEDVKIIVRPKKGLPLKNYTTVEITRAIAQACDDRVQYLHDLIIRPRLGSNIIVLSTSNMEAADLLRKITHIALGGAQHEVVAYVAFSDQEVRGVVHGFPPKTTPEELMQGLRVRTQNTKIIQARMLGTSKTALITFEGDTVPRAVYFYGGEMPCFLYKPTRQVCYICMSTGHRSDVCPTPNAKKCSICGIENPTEDHSCQPKCALCGEGHMTGARECKLKLRKARIPPGNQNQKSRNKKNEENKKQTRPRWFSTEWPSLEDAQGTRGTRDCSISRQPVTDVEEEPKKTSTKKNKEQQIRSTEPPSYEVHSPETTKQAKSKKASQLQGETAGPSTPGSHLGRRSESGQEDQTQEKSTKVSWPKVAASITNTNKTDTHQTKQDLIIEELRAQIAKQNAEIAELKKQLRENELRAGANYQDRMQGTNPNPFTPQTSPAPIPSPAVPLTLLQDPSGIGLFLAKMQEAFNNRLDQIQSQITTSLRKSGEGKRKLKMPRNPKGEKQQAMEADVESSDIEETESEDEDP